MNQERGMFGCGRLRVVRAAFLIALCASFASGQPPVGSRDNLFSELRDWMNVSRLDRGKVICRSSRSPLEASNDDAGNYLAGEGGIAGNICFKDTGPGAIVRMQFTTNSDEVFSIAPIRVYLDGSLAIQGSWDELVSGEFREFFSPLVGRTRQSVWSYVPIHYASSCYVTIETGHSPIFYQIESRRLSSSSGWDSWDSSDPTSSQSGLCARQLLECRAAARTWGHAGDRMSPASVVSSGLRRFSASVPTTFYDSTGSGAGAIVELWMRPEPGSATTFAGSRLRITTDGVRTTADVPVLAFFGCALGGLESFRGLGFGRSAGGYYCHFPMPYSGSIQLALYTPSSGPVEARWRIARRAMSSIAEYGRFRSRYALTDPQTDPFVPLAVTNESGHFVGLHLSVESGSDSPGLWFFEGDEHIYVDGETYETAAITGNGIEDTFNGAYYFSGGAQWGPAAGCSLQWGWGWGDDVGAFEPSSVSLFRYRVAEAPSFTSSLDVAYETLYLAGAIPDYRYTSVAFWYEEAD